MDQLRIFITYTHEDRKIASALEALLNQALGPAVHVFRDETAIPYGSDIKGQIVQELEQADVLVALIAGGQAASGLSWVGYEVGTFEGAWRRKQLPEDPSNRSVIGQVVVLCDEGVELGPQTGKRPVRLGIPTNILSEPDKDKNRGELRGQARRQTEVLKLLQDMETLVKDSQHKEFFEGRQNSLDDLVTDFKVSAFDELKGRVTSESKPTKHVVIRFSGAAIRDDYLALPDNSTLSFSDQTTSVFGLRQDERSLFKKVEKPPAGLVRYETTWGEFKQALAVHRYRAYWIGIIEQALFEAKKGDAASDANLVLVADNERRHRVVPTTVTTYLNNDSEVSLYLVEALQRVDRGEEATSNLLNGITMVCRFRFAFLEFKSDFYHENFATNIGTPQSRAKELLMELDYLRSEAIHSNIEKPGVWLFFMEQNRLAEMLRIWRDVDLKLRAACGALLGLSRGAPSSDLDARVAEIVSQLKRIDQELRPFNAELGQVIAREMETVFKCDKFAPAARKEGKETPSPPATGNTVEKVKI